MNLENVVLEKISLHHVGNAAKEEKLILSEQELQPDIELEERLVEFFLGKFKNSLDQYRFTHPNALSFNEVYNFCRSIFAAEEFHPKTQEIAKQLYQQSDHPMIKSGELYVCQFDGCFVDGQTCKAIGIFKTETKSGFFEIQRASGDMNIAYKEGIDLKKLDKGCVVFNVDEEEGYKTIIIDTQCKGSEAAFWKEDFLGLEVISNEFFQTTHVLDTARQFITGKLPEEFELDKTDEIELMSRSVEYFKNKEHYNQSEFEEEVFQDDSVIDSYRTFERNVRDENNLNIEPLFEVSPQAVRKQQKFFKSILKLDKNFHVYIHGDREKIIKGADEDGNKFYKLYYDEEK